MNKVDRQKAIKEIIASSEIKTQKQLANALRDRGMKVTQATVSRDIAEIPLQKIRTQDGIVYHWQGPATEPGDRLARIVRESVLSVSRSENLVLLKTGPGMAAPVAVALDETSLDPKLGTIAGDDTVLVIAVSAGAGRELHDLLTKLSGTP